MKSMRNFFIKLALAILKRCRYNFPEGEMIISRNKKIKSKDTWKINPDGYYPYCPYCYHEPKNGVMSNYCPDCGKDLRGI